MGIEPSAIASQSIASQDVPVVIELLTVQPIAGALLTTARPPGQLVGFYNGSTDVVELYVVANSGLRLLRVG